MTCEDLSVGLLRTEIADRVAILTLDDPDRRNSLTLALVAEITAAFDALEASSDVGAVVVTGAPPAFCAGADLSHLGRSHGGSARDNLLAIYEGFLRLARSPLPTITAVNGAAVGAGMNLALAADVRLAGRSARFDTRFLQLGLHPGGGHTWMLQRITGPQTAAATVLFGEVLDGPEAERVGLVWRCVADDDLLGEAQRLAGRAASAPPGVVARTKGTLAAMADVTSHDDAVERELDPQLWSLAQPEFADRLAALQAKITRR